MYANTTITMTNLNSKAMVSAEREARIKAILGNFEVSSDQLHVELVSLCDDLRTSSKLEVVTDHALELVFSSQTRGLARRQIADWIGTYTPIHVKWKDNGQFDKVIFSDRYVKKAKDAGRPVWDMNGLAANHWSDHAGVSTTLAKAPEIAKIQDQVARQLARESWERFQTTDAATLGGAIESTLDAFLSELREKLSKGITEHQSKDSFAEWTVRRDSDRMKEVARKAKGKGVDAEKIAARRAELEKAKAVTYVEFHENELKELREGIADGLITVDDLPLKLRHEQIEYVLDSTIH